MIMLLEAQALRPEKGVSIMLDHNSLALTVQRRAREGFMCSWTRSTARIKEKKEKKRWICESRDDSLLLDPLTSTVNMKKKGDGRLKVKLLHGC